ncbi:MAG: carbamoyl-phosphate synthase small subunit [Betaproteobacteria bacterium]|nr:MAG: carbamoyl-phosphate synthase small subunit [Betaproteobacteria bacterium]
MNAPALRLPLQPPVRPDPAHALASLTLEDGTAMHGRGIGAAKAVRGEVVFNTAMAGYVEALTDPSYCGQILVLTYPLAGNYGVPPPRRPESLDGPYESGRIQVQGLVVQNYVEAYSHHAACRSLHEWLSAEGVPGLTGVDTRNLTRRLRERGTMKGWLLPSSMGKNDAGAVDMREQVFRIVAPREPVRYGDAGPTILLVDAGAKDNIVRSLLRRGASQVRSLLASYRKPIFGVCLGNQILALAAGADTYKLPYGHRGVNQPVQDLLTRRCYVTSQNHGYAVRDQSLPRDWEPWFVNINDGSNEGIRSRHHPHFSVQFHPEASPGPQDTGFLFDDFLRRVASVAQR